MLTQNTSNGTSFEETIADQEEACFNKNRNFIGSNYITR